jgi:hypothetical protein
MKIGYTRSVGKENKAKQNNRQKERKCRQLRPARRK